MEAAGLAVGAFALVGLIQNCIDLFGYISASRALGRDYELLNTKLDVEKTLLLQWAERVRILKHDYNSELDKPDVARVVKSVLSSIRLLLSDSQLLQDRYGIKQEAQHAAGNAHSHSVADGATPGQPNHILSFSRMKRFQRDFKDLNISKEKRCDQFPVILKARWAIHDKDQFEGLLKELSYFVQKLNEIVPDVNGVSRSMTEEDLNDLHLARLHLILEASEGREKLLATSAQRTIHQRHTKRILDRLWYRDIDTRRLSVVDPHKTSLRWALNPPKSNSGHDWSSLSQWFEHDSGIYWVSGKAGSGKSTLMKYLYNLKECHSLLRNWAGSAPFTKVNFFFDAHGVEEQKSHQGLSRALLYQILNAEETLVPDLLPDMWKEAQISEENRLLKLPSDGELESAFSFIQKGLGVSRRFCFFIDGLDEYSGNYLDGISLIENLAANPSIKVIVSSRPIPLCAQAFGEGPKLQLHDLTWCDIASYIDDIVGSHTYMKRLALSDPVGTRKILEFLVNKASGVFLWVVLACRSLIEGFAAFDNVAELYKRIFELPQKLQDLFRYMLARIEPRYRLEAAKMLRILYKDRSECGERISTIGLATAYRFNLNPSQVTIPELLSIEEKKAECEMLEGRLRSRCGGLIEVSRLSKLRYTDEDGIVHMDPMRDHIINSKVDFIHRTVFEYLDSPGVMNDELLRVHDPCFHLDSVIACIWLQELAFSNDGRFKLRTLMRYAAEADVSHRRFILPTMRKLEQLLQENQGLYSHLRCSETLPGYYSTIPREDFPFALFLSIEVGMVNFAQLQMTTMPPSSYWARMLMMHAIRRPVLSGHSRKKPLAKSVFWLLGLNLESVTEAFAGPKDAHTSPHRVWLRYLTRYTKFFQDHLDDRRKAKSWITTEEAAMLYGILDATKDTPSAFLPENQGPPTEWALEIRGVVMAAIQWGRSKDPNQK